LGRKAGSEENDAESEPSFSRWLYLSYHSPLPPKAIPTEVFPRSMAVFTLGFPSQEARSCRKILLVDSSDSLSIWHALITVEKNIQHDCPKSARSFVALRF
jgi:hypothetical protein